MILIKVSISQNRTCCRTAGAICLSPEGRAPTLTVGVTGPHLHNGNHTSYSTGLKPPKTAMLIFNTVKTSYLIETKSISYVYLTVRHLVSWIKIDQLDVTCFIISLFNAQHVSDVSTSIFRSLRLIVDLFHVLYCPAEPHRNTNTHRTRAIQHMK